MGRIFMLQGFLNFVNLKTSRKFLSFHCIHCILYFLINDTQSIQFCKAQLQVQLQPMFSILPTIQQPVEVEESPVEIP